MIPPRDSWIDAARGSVALSVILFHFNSEVSSTGGAWRDFWSSGYFRVPFFFVVSGWCITLSWLRASSWHDFGLKRLRRILPQYYASLVLVLLLAVACKFVFGVNDIAKLPVSLPDVAATVSLTTSPVTPVPALNLVYWSLSIIVAFYVVLSGLLLVPGTKARLVAITLAHIALCAGAVLLVHHTYGPLFFVPHWHLFGLGAGLALLGTAPLWATIMLAASALHAGWLVFGQHATEALAIALLTGTALLFMRRLPFPTLLAPLRQLGLFSYSILLVHVPAGRFLSHHLLPSMRSTGLALVVAQLVGVAAVLAVAWGFHHLCERLFFRSLESQPA